VTKYNRHSKTRKHLNTSDLNLESNCSSETLIIVRRKYATSKSREPKHEEVKCYAVPCGIRRGKEIGRQEVMPGLKLSRAGTIITSAKREISVRTSQETHNISATDTNRLMLFGETVPVYCENHKEHTSTLCGQNAETLYIRIQSVPHRKHITSPLQSPNG
jgi:hypothetical protein